MRQGSLSGLRSECLASRRICLDGAVWAGGLEFTWRTPVTPILLSSPSWPLSHGHLRSRLSHPPRPPRRHRYRKSGSSVDQGETTATWWNYCSSAAATVSTLCPVPGPGRWTWGQRRYPRSTETWTCSRQAGRCREEARKPPKAPPPTSCPPSSKRRTAAEMSFPKRPRARCEANRKTEPALPWRRVDATPALSRPVERGFLRQTLSANHTSQDSGGALLFKDLRLNLSSQGRSGSPDIPNLPRCCSSFET